MEYGTVITTEESPTTTKFSFVVSDSTRVRKGKYVQLTGEEGLVVGVIQDIVRANRYFEHAESIHEYDKGGLSSSVMENFPAGEWEFAVANCQILGCWDDGRLKRSSYPPAPGVKVQACDESLLKKFLGFEDTGLALGKLFQHDVEVKVNLTRLFQKHLALLAQSGAGKSYAAAVLIEEVLARKKEQGRLAVAVIDVHGEYTGLAEKRHNPDLAGLVSVVNADKMRIGASHLTPQMLAEFLPDISAPQLRDLAPVLHAAKAKAKELEQPFTLKDLFDAVAASDIRDNSKQALLAWLSELRSLRIVGAHDFPNLKRNLMPGHLTVFDFSQIIHQRKKQVLVAYLAKKMFAMRRQKELPPFLLMVEEAHNFAPEKVERRGAISRSIIETIAREGRKFGASLCLISQRPVKLSTTALSQMNTFLILRVTNPYDLDHIAQSCEAVDKETAGSITTLKTGEGILLGEAVNHPIFLKVRARKSKSAGGGTDLETQSRQYEDDQKIAAAVSEVDAAEAFL